MQSVLLNDNLMIKYLTFIFYCLNVKLQDNVYTLKTKTVFFSLTLTLIPFKVRNEIFLKADNNGFIRKIKLLTDFRKLVFSMFSSSRCLGTLFHSQFELSANVDFILIFFLVILSQRAIQFLKIFDFCLEFDLQLVILNLPDNVSN